MPNSPHTRMLSKREKDVLEEGSLSKIVYLHEPFDEPFSC